MYYLYACPWATQITMILDESMCVVREDLTEWLQHYLFSTANASPIAASCLLYRLASGLWLSRLAYKLHYSILESGFETTLKSTISSKTKNKEVRSYEFLRGALSNRDLKNMSAFSLPSFPSTLADCAKLPLGPTDLCSFSSLQNTCSNNSSITNHDDDFPKENIFLKSRVADRWIARDNVSAFIKWCKDLGVPQTLLFETNGLVNRTEEKNVLLTLMEVARIASRYGLTDLPYLVRMEREIDELEAKHSSQDENYKDNSYFSNINHFTSQVVISLKRIDHENSGESEKLTLTPSDKKVQEGNSGAQSVGSYINGNSKSVDTDSVDSPSQSYSTNENNNNSMQTRLGSKDVSYDGTSLSYYVQGNVKTVHKSSSAAKINGTYNSQSDDCRNVSAQVDTIDHDHHNSTCNHITVQTDGDNAFDQVKRLCGLSGSPMSLDGDDGTHNMVTDRFVQQQVNKKLAQCTCCNRLHMQRLEEGRYRLGTRIYYLRRFRNHVMVRVGGGWLTLDEFLQRHDPCRRGVLPCAMETSIVSTCVPPIKSSFDVMKPIRRSSDFDSSSVPHVHSVSNLFRQSSDGSSNCSMESPRSESSTVSTVLVTGVSNGGNINSQSSTALNTSKNKQSKVIVTPRLTVPKAPNLRTASRTRDSHRNRDDSIPKLPHTTVSSCSLASPATHMNSTHRTRDSRAVSCSRNPSAKHREDSKSKAPNLKPVSRSRDSSTKREASKPLNHLPQSTTSRNPWRN